MASAAVMEKAGNRDYQDRHLSEIFQKGMSFSGFERDNLYMSRGDGTYLEISGVSGLDSITDGRGSAFADLDNDGDLDVVTVPLQEVARLLFRNNVGQNNGFIRVRLTGTRSGTDAFGTVVRLETPLGTETKIKLGGSGFLSSSDPRLLFGLGPRELWRETYALELVWPSGLVETVKGLRPGESVHVTEGRGQARRVTERRFHLPGPEASSDRIFRSLAFPRGERVPPLTLTGLSGSSSPAPLASLLEPGRKTLVNLWATWCAPCAAEMPELARMYESLSRAGVDLIGISLDFGQVEKVRSYLEERSIPYRNFLLSEKDLPLLFASGRAVVPLSLLLDERGSIIRVFSGWTAETRAGIDALLAAGK